MNAKYQLIEYNNDFKNDWDNLVLHSPNSTLLHYRDFIEYHKDRFEDASYLLIKNDTLVGVLPASKNIDIFVSHAGLTYGGIVVGYNMPIVEIAIFLELLITQLREQKFKTFRYKQMPYIYHQDCASIDEYTLHQLGFQHESCSLSSFCKFNKIRNYTTEKKRNIKKALSKKVVIKKSDDWSQFWDILTNNLHQRHQAKPTHTLSEIQYLNKKFPNQIQLFGAYLDNELLAATALFISKNVVHLQYISSSPKGRSMSANDLLVDTILNDATWRQTFFDYGVSTEDGGKYLNTGLIHHKEGFDLYPITYNTFLLDL